MTSPVDLGQIPGFITAVGALGVAAYGAVEAIGKTLVVFQVPLPGGRTYSLGLPYVGFGKIQKLVVKVGPALAVTYGDDFEQVLRQQYRAGRGGGKAPESIRQGVRLGLPFLEPDAATAVIKAVWGLSAEKSAQLATALTGGGGAAPDAALAGRFATALDSRVQAAFDIAEEVYETRAQFWAAVVAIGLALTYQGAVAGWLINAANLTDWAIALLAGLVAVPLAPAAKDLSTSISDALGALSKLRGGK